MSTRYLRNPSRRNPKNSRPMRYSPRGPLIAILLSTNGRTSDPMAKIGPKGFTLTSTNQTYPTNGTQMMPL